MYSAHNKALNRSLFFPLPLASRIWNVFTSAFCFNPVFPISFKTTSIAIPTDSGALLSSPGDKVPCDNRWPLLACHFPSPMYLLLGYSAWGNAICTQGHKCCFLCIYLYHCHHAICSDDTWNYYSLCTFPFG